MVKLLIVGPNGNVGRALVRAAARTPRIDLIGGVGPKGRDYIGADLGLLVGLGKYLGAKVFDNIEHVIDASDVVLECTRPAVSIAVLDACLDHQKAFATGTTGFSEEQVTRIRHAGETIPVLHAANGSPIVHLLYKLVHLVSREVGREADVDIVEMHRSTKLDAPSGTAIEIAKIITDTLGLDLDRAAEYGRRATGQRESESIQYSSIRSGGTPSTHRVIFGFPNERLELTHYAYNTDAFADGLIKAALFVGDKDRGFYTLRDAFEDR
jgi:4-hydroxy-tetrahydrodipicolinate reductase